MKHLTLIVLSIPVIVIWAVSEVITSTAQFLVVIPFSTVAKVSSEVSDLLLNHWNS